MIDQATAWRRFVNAQAKMDHWLEQYTWLYEATAKRLQQTTAKRSAPPITLDQAKAMVDAMTTPTGFSAVYVAWENYKRWREETKVARDVWLGIREGAAAGAR